MMKIGFDAKRLFCNFTGLGNYSRSLVKNLAEFQPGNELILYTTEARRSPETNYFLQNSSFKTVVANTNFKALWRSYFIGNQLKKDNLSIYHGLSHELPFGIGKLGIKSVVSIHDLIFKHYPETYKYTDRTIYDLKFSYACRNASRIIAISENTKLDIIKFYKIPEKKIEVIYQACNPLFYTLQEKNVNDKICRQYGIPSDYILYVGSIEARKNLKTLVKAYNNLNSTLKVPLVIVGRGGKYKSEVEQIVSKLGLQSSIIWIDRLTDNSHLQSVYQNATVLVYPSLYEGFGLPVAEALLSKTPVITSETSSLPEAGGPGTIYFDPTNAEQLTACLEKVLADNTLRQKMVAMGYSYAMEKFSPQNLSLNLMDCYRNA